MFKEDSRRKKSCSLSEHTWYDHDMMVLLLIVLKPIERKRINRKVDQILMISYNVEII